ncbi:transmembrane protein 199-like [Centruroides sculpturatus]|uniref:transmembrane protein 199-like n=1 Tax=Centruroides sculpturatus TaxID=218467 RepID=UPI000C6DF540|nr:transmembrane protein 199-like [Centruroides sculpturatus]
MPERKLPYKDVKDALIHWLMQIHSSNLPVSGPILKQKGMEIAENPELEARIQKLKAEQEEREYHEMTKNVSMSSFKKSSSFQSEIRSVRSQITAVLNGVLTVAGTFIFGFKAAEYLFSVSDLITKFCVGFSLAMLVAVAELYFLIPIV